MPAHPPVDTAPCTVVLFDLDGTISDSAPGILASLRAAFAEMGVPPLDAASERHVLGPPFRESLPPLIGEQRVEEAITRYRAHYAGGGLLVTSAYDGIAAVLSALHDDGIRLGLATSKAEMFAPRILAHLGLLERFDVVCGDDADGRRGTKSAVVAEALRRLGDPDPATVVMVGDRSHDVVGAADHGIGTLGAGWGYGAPGELEQAGAQVVLDRPEQLLLQLRRAT